VHQSGISLKLRPAFDEAVLTLGIFDLAALRTTEGLIRITCVSDV
jgi:hypothetical protein